MQLSRIVQSVMASLMASKVFVRIMCNCGMDMKSVLQNLGGGAALELMWRPAQ